LGRKAKVEVLYPGYSLNPHHTQRLDSLRAIRIEQSRLYRATIRGRLPSEELTKLFFCLREIRSTLELELVAAPTQPPKPTTINIMSVPCGTIVRETEGLSPTDPKQLVIEHQPDLAPQVEVESTPEPASIEGARRSELNAMPIERLLLLAGVADVDAG
jgi:hypothetical protein